MKVFNTQTSGTVPSARRTARWRWSAATVLAMLTAGLVSAPAQPALAASTPTPPTPTLAWTDCSDGFQCATARVPLDYRQPRGRQIDLALIRLPASDPAHRAGAIFINPGGPGISGIGVARGAEQIFNADVRARYDIVGFDPRGVGASTPVKCFATDAQAQAFWAGTPTFPITRDQERTVAATADEYRRQCEQRSGDLLRHVTTADVARDMDLLRAALGDTTLNYWGLSYGSYLGEVYANMFPGRVRAMVLDGVVDPHAWADDTVDLLASEAVAAEHTLDAFLTTCAAAGASRCPFADTSAQPDGSLHGKLDLLFARARQEMLTVPGSQPPQAITYQDLVGGIDGAMDEPGSWLNLAQALQALTTGDPGGVGALQAIGIPPAALPPAAEYDNTGDASQAVFCADTAMPRNPSAWPVIQNRIAQQAPLMSPVRLYSEMPCATWPRTVARYTGPWNRHTGTPILLVSVTDDPSTPYSGGEQAARELGDARVLTVDGYGHMSIHAGSSCALAAENQYLLSAQAPPAGTHCGVDYAPF
ncbi:alpha/beta hydrolase [Rugosimonospora africana]|nr:alpha/beta hydrolase [Rugosimonospora africana]